MLNPSSQLSGVRAIDVVTGKRLDVFSKVQYVRSSNHGEVNRWARLLYRSFLNACNPNGHFNEDGIKFSILDYEREFDFLIESIRSLGFDLNKGSIPITSTGINNGAHRLAACLVLRQELTVRWTDSADQIYDYRFMNRIGLPAIFTHAMAFDLISEMPNSRVFVLTGLEPKVSAFIIKRVEAVCDPIIHVHFLLTEVGKRRLMSLSYGHNIWWKEEYLETMVHERFAEKNSFGDAIFFLIPEGIDLQDLKTSLREDLPTGVFNRQIHGSDGYSDTLILAEVLLNENGRRFMNSAPIGSENRILNFLADGVNLNPPIGGGRDWCIDGSSVLEIFGIRQARDLDFVSLDLSVVPDAIRMRGDDHNSEYLEKPISNTDIIYDPRHHFWYRGFKFAAISTVTFFKAFDLGDKSINDLRLVSKFFSQTGPIYRDTSSSRNALKYRVWLKFINLAENLISLLPTFLRARTRALLVGISRGFKRVLKI